MSGASLPIDPVIPPWTNALGIKRVAGYHVYVVRWPSDLTKAGVGSYPSRWGGYARSGGELVCLLSSNVRDLEGVETALHDFMETLGPRAFWSAEEAVEYLPGGAGWTECYELDELDFNTFAEYTRNLATRREWSA